MKFFCFLKKYFFLIVLLFASNEFVFAQNGIPLTKLREAPYFVEEEKEEGEETEDKDENKKEEKKKNKNKMNETEEEQIEIQYTNPSDVETFYNSQNWPGKISGTAEKMLEPKGDDEEDGYVPFNQASSGLVMATDEMKAGTDELTYLKSAKHFLSFSYMPLEGLVLFENSLGESYGMKAIDSFESFKSSFVPLGLDFMYRNFALGKKGFKAGYGLNLGYNLFKYENENYCITSNAVFINAFLCTKIYFTARSGFTLFAGGGGFLVIQPCITYLDSQLQVYDKDYLYPAVCGGFCFDYYFSKHVGITFSARGTLPFILEPYFPMIQASLGIGVLL